ncbi:MAG: hypothetical protein QNK03_22540, partial [Myxococcota bacterium]|nr:hypothetical protein [Myxococcota bacterium]
MGLTFGLVAVGCGREAEVPGGARIEGRILHGAVPLARLRARVLDTDGAGAVLGEGWVADGAFSLPIEPYAGDVLLEAFAGVFDDPLGAGPRQLPTPPADLLAVVSDVPSSGAVRGVTLSVLTTVAAWRVLGGEDAEAATAAVAARFSLSRLDATPFVALDAATGSLHGDGPQHARGVAAFVHAAGALSAARGEAVDAGRLAAVLGGAPSDVVGDAPSAAEVDAALANALLAVRVRFPGGAGGGAADAPGDVVPLACTAVGFARGRREAPGESAIDVRVSNPSPLPVYAPLRLSVDAITTPGASVLLEDGTPAAAGVFERDLDVAPGAARELSLRFLNPERRPLEFRSSVSGRVALAPDPLPAAVVLDFTPFDAPAGEALRRVRIANTGADPVYGPLRLRVQVLAPPGAAVVDAAGDPRAEAEWVVPGSARLDPGETLETLELRFTGADPSLAFDAELRGLDRLALQDVGHLVRVALRPGTGAGPGESAFEVDFTNDADLPLPGPFHLAIGAIEPIEVDFLNSAGRLADCRPVFRLDAERVDPGETLTATLRFLVPEGELASFDVSVLATVTELGPVIVVEAPEDGQLVAATEVAVRG